MLDEVFKYKNNDSNILSQEHTAIINSNNNSKQSWKNYTYIPPNNRNCTYINSLFNNLWIEPIEITVFAMLNTFKSLNIPCVLYGGTLLSYMRHINILSWDKDGDLAFLLPLNYTLRLDEFMSDVFIPKLNRLYPHLHFTCIINTDAMYSLFNCRLINKPGYVDAFAEYGLYNKKLYNKLQVVIKEHSIDVYSLRNEIINDNKKKLNDKRNKMKPFIWNEHFLDTSIHLKPISILFPGKYKFWNTFYENKYNISKVSVPQNEIEIGTIFYGKDYMIPPSFAHKESNVYGICDRQKSRIEKFCFGSDTVSKYDRGGLTVKVTESEINLCNDYEKYFRNINKYNEDDYQFYDTDITYK